jgi:hypothetical protein
MAVQEKHRAVARSSWPERCFAKGGETTVNWQFYGMPIPEPTPALLLGPALLLLVRRRTKSAVPIHKIH